MEIPEWGGAIKVRAITNGEFSRVQRQATSKGGDLDAIKANALIIEFACVKPKFSPGGYRKLLGREAGILARIAETFRLCLELGIPHPRYLDELLTYGDLMTWAAFLSWHYKPRDG
ncbi:MAG: hypothetical protein ACYTAO_24405 [Planctomycetota bacterium]|jgi:hypothetical protein